MPTARLSQGVSIVLCAPDDRSCPHRRGLEVGFRRFVGEFLFSVAQNTNYNPFNLFYQEIPELNLRVKRGLAGAAPAEEARASTIKEERRIRSTGVSPPLNQRELQRA